MGDHPKESVFTREIQRRELADRLGYLLAKEWLRRRQHDGAASANAPRRPTARGPDEPPDRGYS
jgi:hypothetical protein